ncbi:MAG: ATP-binding cassette domain-containing protein [Sulfolobales archaeon]
MGYAIEIEDLWFRYPLSEDWVLRGVNINIREGEFVAIMGPSGCGKSTLLYILAGIIPNMIKGEIKGSVRVLGREILNLRPEDIVRNVGFVFQNPDSQLLMPTVLEEVIMGLENLGLPREEILARAWDVIRYVGLEGKARQSPRSLSAGEKQILAIASVLALKPRILILDEPTSMLDHIGTARVLGLIERLKREARITVIVVEHRIEWAVEVADKIAIMNNGRIEAFGDPREVFGDPDLVRRTGIRPPMISEVFYRLAEEGLEIHRIPVTVSEGIDAIKRILGDHLGYTNRS